MEQNNIMVMKENGIATIRLNRPKYLNALNSAISSEMKDALEAIRLDPAIRVLIITGNGKAFAAGADVKEMSVATPRYAREFCSLAIDINTMLENLPIPTIAAINGFAFGGGLELALACDFRVGGSRTLLALPEVGLGIIPGANGCARATAIVGIAKAKQLIMLTEKVPGQVAYDLGLLNWLVPGDSSLDAAAKEAQAAFKAAKTDGDTASLTELENTAKSAEDAAAAAEAEAIYTKAVAIANSLIAKPKCALAAAKAAINKAANETVLAGMATETAEFTLLFDTHDQKEGMAAMLEKRAAVFTNN